MKRPVEQLQSLRSMKRAGGLSLMFYNDLSHLDSDSQISNDVPFYKLFSIDQ